MTKQEAEEILDLVIDLAPKLREAGVLELAITDDGLRTKLAPAVPESADAPVVKPEAKDGIWDDEMLFPKKHDDQKKKG